MAGKWMTIWDDHSQCWREVWFDDWPEADSLGSVTVTGNEKKDIVILGSDGKPLTKPPGRRVGF
jgi:hypothetical protein